VLQPRTWSKSILLGLVFCLKAFTVDAKDPPPFEPKITVGVRDRAAVPPGILAEAERTASSIFRQAGLQVELVNCGPGTENVQAAVPCKTSQFPNCLQLTIMPGSTNFSRSTLGVAYLDPEGFGCYAEVFFEPAEDLPRQLLQVQLGMLLGHVMAHEIAHLLLGTNSHSDTGIMRAHWHPEDLELAKRSRLLFTPAQAGTMRERVARGLRAAANGAVAPSSGTS